MRLGLVLACVAAGTLVAAQNSQSSNPPPSGSNSGGQSQTTSARLTTSTFITTSVGLGNNRQTTTAVITSLATFTVSPSNGPSATVPSQPSSSTSLTPAPSDVEGGGHGLGGAPSPGAAGGGGVYGPDDTYIAAATSLSLLIASLISAGAFAGLLLL